MLKGDQGNYKETDPVYPVNKYAWSKLGGECAVRMYDKSLIIRTTFGPNVFPYQKAFVDHGAIQCGFCTPGMVLSAKALLDECPEPTEEEIRHLVVSNPAAAFTIQVRLET